MRGEGRGGKEEYIGQGRIRLAGKKFSYRCKVLACSLSAFHMLLVFIDGLLESLGRRRERNV